MNLGRQNDKFANVLLKSIPAIYYKRLLQISTLTMRQGKQSFPPDRNGVDIICLASHNKIAAEILVSDDEIIENLIISLRSRNTACEYNDREVVITLYFIIYEHRLLPKKYYYDAILAFMDIRETEWKNFGVLAIFPCKSSHDMVVRCLSFLFGIKEFKRINYEEYVCAVCQQEIKWPHTLPCKHSLCYTCLTGLIIHSRYLSSAEATYNYWFAKHKIKPHQCPICRTQFYGEFNRDDEKSAFVLNKRLSNKIYSEIGVIDSDEDHLKKFKGTEYEYWEYLKMNHKIHNDILQKEFIQFCEFMKQKTKVIVADDIDKELRQRIIKSQKLKKNGNALFEKQEYKKAIKNYEEALKICPLFDYANRAVYYSNIGMCYSKMGHHLNAFRASQNGLALYPKKCKLLFTAFLSLHELLPNDSNAGNQEEEKKQASVSSLFYQYIHSDIIEVGNSNKHSLNRRIYDILLSQYCWDFEFLLP